MTVSGLVVLGTPVRGASIGRLHAQQTSTSLPALHEPVPLHVPVLSNAALLKLWQTNQFSPIFRDPKIEMQLCTAVSAARSVNPTRFDRNHPILGHLIRDPNFFKTVLAAYNSNPARFTQFHHRLIPFIRGCALMTETPTTPPSTGVGSGEVTSPGGSTIVSPIPEGVTNGPPPVTLPEAVPAPPGIVLLLFGMSFVATRLRGRRLLASS
jgi:hypothetical protein